MQEHALSGSSALLEAILRQARGALQSGGLDEAEAGYRRVLAALPQHAEANYNLSLILLNSDRLSEAERRMERVVKAAPRDAAAQFLLARIMARLNKTTRSLFLLRRALTLAPQDVELWLEAIALAAQQGQPMEADALAKQAVARFADQADLYLQAGLAWLNNNDNARARGWFEQALAVDPHHPAAMFQLAGLDELAGDYGNALRRYRQAQALDTGKQLRDICLGDLELRQGEVKQAVETLRQRLKTYPNDLVALTNYLMASQYVPGVSIASLRETHAIWQDCVGEKLRETWLPHANSRDPDRVLRIGLVSADLRAHPVGYFTVPGIEALDPAQFEVVCYNADPPANDPIAMRFRNRAQLWRDVATVNDEALAAQIRRDQIDILIDLAGQTTNGRLPMFARKPAPVQLSWAGYFGTTGCDAIDGLLEDPTLVPQDEETQYREAIWRMPDGYLCYDPPAEAPEVTPRQDDGVFRLAAFHNPAKINRDVVALWARVMHAVAPMPVELWLTYNGYQDVDVQARIGGWFAEHGIAASSLHFQGFLPRAAYFAALAQTDIGLDPFPYSGGAITCDALWMGVPVITLPGVTVAGRHSATHLHAAGLDQLIAADADDYVAKVVALAQNPAKLAALRAGLRAQLAGSALCDAPRFGANLGALLREIWRDYLARSVEQA